MATPDENLDFWFPDGPNPADQARLAILGRAIAFAEAAHLASPSALCKACEMGVRQP